MKLLLFFLTLTTILFAETKEIEDKTKLAYEDFRKEIRLSDVALLPNVQTFIPITGASQEVFDDAIKNAFKDEEFMKAIYFLYFTKMEYNVKYGDKMNRNMPAPKIEEGLEILSKYVKRSNNVIGAHIGLNIVMKLYMASNISPIAKKYTAIFAKPLYENKFCIGGLMLGRTYLGFYGRKDVLIANQVLEDTDNSCLKDNIPEYIPHQVKHALSLAHYYKDGADK